MRHTSRRFLLVASMLLAGALVGELRLAAHHGRAATYDASVDVTIRGTVTEWAWRNPHVAIYLDSENESGEVVNWAFEGQNTSMLAHNDGLHRNSLRVGQRITVVANPARNGTPIGVIKKVVLEDGNEIMVFGAGAAAP